MDSLVLMGPPGAGKGTQANFLSHHYSLYHISTGDLVRREMAAHSALGEKIRSIVIEGHLPGDEDIYVLLEKELKKIPLEQGIIFDGFPRRLAQAEYLDQVLVSLNRKLGWVISIDVESEVLVKRIIGRLSCKKCGASYNLYYKQPQEAGICDECHTPLEKRSDDNEEVLRTRISEYEAQVQALAGYYERKKVFYRIHGNCTEKEVSLELQKIVGCNYQPTQCKLL